MNLHIMLLEKCIARRILATGIEGSLQLHLLLVAGIEDLQLKQPVTVVV